MANFFNLFIFIAFFLVVPSSVLAGIDHFVGDRSGWNTGVDFSSWASGKTFFVGDALVFRYKKGLHNVFDVNVTTFAECATPSNQRPLESGNDVVRLLRPGIRWFISTIAHDCQSGQKLVISVQNPPVTPTVGRVPPPPFSLPSIPFQLAPSPPSSLPPTSSSPAPPPPSSLPPSPLPAPLPPSSLPPTSVPSLPPSTSLPPSPVPALPPTPVPALPPPTAAASSPSVLPPPGQNQTNPQLPVPTPSESPSHSPGPSATASPPSGAAAKSPVSGHLGFLAVAVAVVAGVMI